MIADRNASYAKLSRLNFLINSAVAGSGLVLSLSLSLGENKAAGAEAFAPNAFIRIGGDGQVVLTMPFVEMGSGHQPNGSMRRARSTALWSMASTPGHPD
jgi:isoquinoline 1-oxidoreductase beta subunit